MNIYQTLIFTFCFLVKFANSTPLEIENLKIAPDNQQIDSDDRLNVDNKIILFMKNHEQSGVISSTKSDAQYYRTLIKRINESEFLVQDFFISGNKLTDPYIATNNDIRYVYNEGVGSDFYPRKGLRVVWYESGQKHANTYYENNKETSTWITWHENGQKNSEITYIKGKENGVSQSWSKSGDLMNECSYKMGVEDGRCYALYHDHPDTLIYDGNFKNGKKTGVWKEWDSDGFLTNVSFYGNLSLSKIKDNVPDGIFAYYNFDVNGDNVKDLIVTHKPDEENVYQGDGLYVLLGQKNNSYASDLEFTNYSADGGISHSAIMPRANNKGFIILGYNHGKYEFYIKNVHNKWILEKYVHDGVITLEEAHFHCVMNINKTITDKYGIELPLIYNDSEKLTTCPVQTNEYKVTSEKAEILDESFEPKNPPNYFIKNNKVTAFYQNEDWIKVRYKNDTKAGWIKRDGLIEISD